MGDLMAYLRTTGQAEGMVMSDEKWKLKFTLSDEKAGPMKAVCNLLQVDEQVLCVEFSRKSGDQLAFLQKFKEIKNALKVYNDATFQ